MGCGQLETCRRICGVPSKSRFRRLFRFRFGCFVDPPLLNPVRMDTFSSPRRSFRIVPTEGRGYTCWSYCTGPTTGESARPADEVALLHRPDEGEVARAADEVVLL